MNNPQRNNAPGVVIKEPNPMSTFCNNLFHIIRPEGDEEQTNTEPADGRQYGNRSGGPGDTLSQRNVGGSLGGKPSDRHTNPQIPRALQDITNDKRRTGDSCNGNPVDGVGVRGESSHNTNGVEPTGMMTDLHPERLGTGPTAGPTEPIDIRSGERADCVMDGVGY